MKDNKKRIQCCKYVRRKMISLKNTIIFFNIFLLITAGFYVSKAKPKLFKLEIDEDNRVEVVKEVETMQYGGGKSELLKIEPKEGTVAKKELKNNNDQKTEPKAVVKTTVAKNEPKKNNDNKENGEGTSSEKEKPWVGKKSEEEKLLNTLINRDEPIQYKNQTKISYNELIGLYDENAPITNVLPNCLKKSSNESTPIVLMSSGRSGSTLLWLMLSDLTNSTNYGETREFVGENKNGSLYFFDTTIPAEEKLVSEDKYNTGHVLRQSGAKLNEVPGLNNSEHGEWMTNYLCRLRREQPGGLVGFKWKPVLIEFAELDEPRESLQVLASVASAAETVGQRPPLVVVRNRRNALDVKLSYMKHEANSDLDAHCKPGDEECIKSHSEKIFIENIKRFHTSVKTIWRQENMIDLMLYELKVPFISVSYDTLFYPDRIADGVKEWNKMIQFVSPQSARVSWADVQNCMDLASTSSSRNHKDIIENWEDVYARFNRTMIQHLFRLN